MRWWRFVAAMELRKILAYRSDFWITFFGQTFIQLGIARSLWHAIFEAQGLTQMGGYSLEAMTLYYLLSPLGSRMLTGENIGFVSSEIYEGTFSRYLIYPLSVFQYKTITYLTHSLFFGVQILLLFAAYKLIFTSNGLTALDLQNLLIGITIFFVASFTYCMMAMSLELISLWADNTWSLIVMLRFVVSFFGGGLLPLVFFPDWALSLLKWTPFPYLVSFPIKTIMGELNPSDILAGTSTLIVWSCAFMLLVQFIWRKGQKTYSGVGI